MRKKNLVKIFSVFMGLVMMMSSFVGCGGEEKKAEAQTIVYNIKGDPQTIDPALNNASDGSIVLYANFEGLTRIDEENKVKMGVAEKIDISPDGRVYTFHLRKDAKWSDGKQVTAKDFEYAWKRVLDPTLASETVNYVYDYIKGAKEYYDQKGKGSWENVGIKVKDDTTLEVTLNNPTGYFTQLTAYGTYFPVRQDMVEKDPTGWTTKAETYIGNGPFKMDSWKHADSMEFSKNANYWDNAKVKLDKMTFVMVIDESSALTSFEKGDIELLDTVVGTEIPRLQKEGKIEISPQYGTYYVLFNCKKKPFDNPKVRKALSLAINRKQIVEKVTRAGEIPAASMVPLGSLDADNKTDFRTKGGEYLKAEGDVAEAKKLLAEAGYPDGKGFPTFTYLYNTSQMHKQIGEALQEMWRNNLGVNCKLANQEFGVVQATRTAGNFEVSRAGWMPDYMDPAGMLDIAVSGNGMNDGKYSSAEFDKNMNIAKTTSDINARYEALHNAEKVMMDEAAFAPIYQYSNKKILKPYVKGLYMTPSGSIYFDHATIDQAAKAEAQKK